MNLVKLKRTISDGKIHIAFTIINAINILFAVGLVILGGRILFRKGSYLIAFFGYDVMRSAAICTIVFGVIVIFIASYGFLAAVSKRQRGLFVFIVLMAVIMILLIILGALALWYRKELEVKAKQRMRDGLLYKYGVNLQNIENAHITEVWNRLQTKNYCCSIEDNSWKIYQNSTWFRSNTGTEEYNKPYVPISCCVYDHHDVFLDPSKCQHSKAGPPGSEEGIYNRALYYRGCFRASESLGLDYFVYAAGLGFFGIVIVVASQIVAILLCRQISRDEEENENEEDKHSRTDRADVEMEDAGQRL